MLWLLSLLSCNDGLLVKHTIEEKYIYPSYYDVWVEVDTAIIEVPVSDTGDPDPIWVDSFVQPSAEEGVDIIWVIDPSGSMHDDKPRVLAGIQAMMDSLPLVNWRLIIISADPNYAINNSEFPLLPGDTYADAHAMYTSSVIGAQEAGLQSVYTYIEDNTFASNWLRENASLLVVFVSDEEDQSPQFPTAYDFTSWYEEARNSVYVASITHWPATESQCNNNDSFVGYKYMSVAQYFNGQTLDICSSDWSAGVLDAANGAVPHTSYPLTEFPADVNSITVFVDGIVYPPTLWHYKPAENRIYFDVVPPGNTLVEIAYYYSSGN